MTILDVEAPVVGATESVPRRRPAAMRGPFEIAATILSILLALLACYPLGRVLARLFLNDGRIDFSPVVDAFTGDGIGRVLVNTIIMVAASSVLAVIIATVLAWLLEHTDARMGRFAAALPMVPFFLPPVAGAVGWILAFSERSGLVNYFLRFLLRKVGIHLTEGPFNVYTWPGLVLVMSLYAVPYAFLVIAAALRNVDPSLDEAARVAGSSPLRTLRTVTLPGLRPALGGATLLCVWFTMSLYSVPVTIGPEADIEVISVRIVRLLREEFPPAIDQAVGLSLFVLATVGTVWYLQRKVLQSGHFMTVGGKGHRRPPLRLGRWKWPARLLVIGYGLVALVLPLCSLLLVAFRGYWTPKIRWSDLSLDAFRRLADDEKSFGALGSSLKLAFLVGIVGIVCAAVVAHHVHRARSRSSRILDGLIKLPAVLSSIVLGVGFILAFGGPPFRLGGTLLILMLGYLVLYLPQASVAADSATAQVGRELTEASRIAGAGGTRTFVRVNLPIMLPGLAAGWAMLFVRITGDLTLSALLSGPTNLVIGVRILEIFQTGSYADLAALSVLLTAVTGTVVIVAMVLARGRRWNRQ